MALRGNIGPFQKGAMGMPTPTLDIYLIASAASVEGIQ